MTFTDFAEKLLMALYQDARLSGEWQDLQAIQLRYGLHGEHRLLSTAAKHLKNEGYIDLRELVGGPIRGRMSGSGMVYIEAKYGSKDGVGTLIEPIPDPTTLERFFDETQTKPETPRIDSSLWTGLPSSFVLTEQRRESLVVLLNQAEQDLDAIGAGNSEKALARAYIVAAKALADTPEPPLDLVWEIINRANQLAGIAALFVSILGLFVH